MHVVFNYYDPHLGKYWPGPEGHSVETERFSAMEKHPPTIVSWRDIYWVLDTVVLDTREGIERVVVHYRRATFDRTKCGYRADDPVE